MTEPQNPKRVSTFGFDALNLFRISPARLDFARAKSGGDFGFRTFQPGQAVLTMVLFLLFASAALLLSFSSIALRESRASRIDLRAKQSFFLAEAGVEDVFYRAQNGMDYGPDSESISIEGAQADIDINVTGSVIEITSEGNVSSAVRRVKTVITTGAGASFRYAIQVGYIGLKMQEQASIIGSVFSNGNIKGGNNTEITGDAWAAKGVGDVADQVQTSQDSALPLRDITDRRDGAQSFIPAKTADAREVKLLVAKVGNPGDATVRILPNNDKGNSDPTDDEPENAGSMANGQLRADDVPADPCTAPDCWVSVAMNANDPLIKEEKYWIIIDNDGDNATKYYTLKASGDSSYSCSADGADQACTFRYIRQWNAASPEWSTPGIDPASPSDAAFQIFLGTVDTSLDMNNSTGDELNIGGEAHAHTIMDAVIGRAAYCIDFDNIRNPLGQQIACDDCSAPGANPDDCNPPPEPLPITDEQIEEWKDAAAKCESVGSCVNGDFELDADETGELSTPIRIAGDLTLENRSLLTLVDDAAIAGEEAIVHVAGNVVLRDNCTVKMDEDFGPPDAEGKVMDGVFVVDGTVDVRNKCDLYGVIDPDDPLGGPYQDSNLLVLSTNHSIANPPAMKIGNLATGAVFYTSEGTLDIQEQAELKAAAGQKMIVGDHSTLTYDEGLTDLRFTSGPTGGWEIRSWNEVE